MNKPLTEEQIIQIVNSRQWPQAFTIAYLEAGLTPYSFIQSLKTSEQEKVHKPKPIKTELTQEEIIDLVEVLGNKHFDKLSWIKHRELIATIRPQWGNAPFTEKAKEFAVGCLTLLESFERHEKDTNDHVHH
jgi:hypothetical protein